MDNDLKVTTKLLRLEQVIAERVGQVVVKESFQVPDPKPPVAQVVDSLTSASVTKVTVVEDKVIVEGELIVKVIYEADVPAQTVHVVEITIPFKHFIEVPGAAPGMQATVRVSVEDISFTVSADGRTITVTAVLALFVKVVQPTQIEVVTGVYGVPGLQVKKELIRTAQVVGEDTKQTLVRDTVVVPCEKPPVKQILDWVASAEVTGTRILTDKVIVEGNVTIKLIYEADVPQQTVHVLHFTVPFRVFVEIPGAMPGMTVHVDVAVEHVSFDVSEDGRSVTVQVVLAVFVKVVEVHDLEVVVDVTGVECIHVVKKVIKVTDVLSEGTTQAIVREVIDIPETKPDVAQIIDYRATAIVNRVFVVPGKVIVEGVVSLKIIYEGKTWQQTVHVVHADIPFKEFVPLPEAVPGMAVSAFARIEHVSFDVPPQGDPIVAQVLLAITARVLRTRQLEVVTEVTGAPGITTGVVVGSVVNVRSGPGLNYSVIAQVRKGDEVTILGVEGSWYRVRLTDGTVGYIFSNLVKVVCPPRG